MAIATFRGVVENGQVRLASNINLPERATVYVVIPDSDVETDKPRFDLARMIAQMPAIYSPVEEGFGPPIGKEEW